LVQINTWFDSFLDANIFLFNGRARITVTYPGWWIIVFNLKLENILPSPLPKTAFNYGIK
jgi:hypothetical protein